MQVPMSDTHSFLSNFSQLQISAIIFDQMCGWSGNSLLIALKKMILWKEYKMYIGFYSFEVSINSS